MKKISLRLLIACVIAFPLCFVGYLFLLIYAVPHLLRSDSAFLTYSGFYLQYPSLIAQVSNLQCVTNGQKYEDEHFYYCRFNVYSSNIERFIKERKLLAQEFEACENIDIFTGLGQYSRKPTWGPSDLEGEGKCYVREPNDRLLLIHSPENQLVYIQETG
ncbi:hypothetical protein NDI44_27095 [Trichocoleus sp. DQ-A3]|uniref:hypothetical protein n=1 Tax=Cyanophyceae TaxID=3028117 RepID=UPI001686F4CB|nr:hypothetical protein [Coleofasciculus sp. FACHB-125]MBD1903854.1 hypothetical protein [Coleofasciculus sp. FACHB-125]